MTSLWHLYLFRLFVLTCEEHLLSFKLLPVFHTHALSILVNYAIVRVLSAQFLLEQRWIDVAALSVLAVRLPVGLSVHN